MKRAPGLLLVLTALCWAQQEQSGPANDLAAVSFSVSTSFGEPVGKVEVVLKSIGPNTEYRQVGSAIHFDRVPFGLYDLAIYASGFGTHRERVGIAQPEVHLWFGLFPSP